MTHNLERQSRRVIEDLQLRHAYIFINYDRNMFIVHAIVISAWPFNQLTILSPLAKFVRRVYLVFPTSSLRCQ